MHKWGVLEGGVPRTMKRALSHGYFSAFLSLAILCAPSLEITTDEIRILKHAGSADTSEATTAEAIACQSHFSSRLTAAVRRIMERQNPAKRESVYAKVK